MGLDVRFLVWGMNSRPNLERLYAAASPALEAAKNAGVDVRGIVLAEAGLQSREQLKTVVELCLQRADSAEPTTHQKHVDALQRTGSRHVD
jgi:hypothetical protein